LVVKKIGIIPARFGASRFNGKPLKKINGISMIARVFMQVSKSNLLDEGIVATDHQDIVAEIKNLSGNCIFSSIDFKNGTERIAAVAKQFDLSDIIINIQGDEPLIEAFAINELNLNEDFDSLNCVKIVKDYNHNALYFSRAKIKGDANKYLKHIGIYGFKNKVLQKIVALPICALEKTEKLEQLRWLYNGYAIKVIQTNYQSISVDVPTDIAKVEAYLDNHN